jgi:hypothetical protein
MKRMPPEQVPVMSATDSDIVIQRTRAENAVYVMDRLRVLGFDPNASSRFPTMNRALQRGDLPFGHPDFWTAIEAERDLQLLAFILEQGFAHADYPGFREKIALLLNDSVLPQNDRGESKGRNAQFELYLAAICQNAGLAQILFEEPDITCVMDGIKLGIAAKRVKHVQQLRKRVKEAANQIAKAGLPGIVAIDVSLALNSENQPISAPLEDELFERAVADLRRWFFRTYGQDIEKAVRGKGVRGTLISHSVVRQLPDADWILNDVTFWLPALEADSLGQYDACFYKRFCRGIPNRADLP